MTANKTKLTIEQFAEIESQLKRIKDQLDPLFDLAWSNDAFRLGRDIAEISGELQGLIYTTHPQTEWTGGDSNDIKNFVKRLPHIAALD